MKRYGAALSLVAAGSLTLSACAAANEPSGGGGGDGGSGSTLSGEIAGAGASSQAAAMEAWIAGFLEGNPDATVTYNPIGSGGGRERFINGATPFGGTDAALDAQELPEAKQRCNGELIEFPAYISPIAVVYNLDGVDNLRLSPQTLAGIFDQQITNWNDPAIAADNPGARLPDLPITPVNRSDESGTTENFLDYLSEAAGQAWPHEVSGNWPVPGGEAAQGTSGVVNAVGAGNGTIGYADASRAGGLGVARIGVGNEFVGPDPQAAARILEASQRVPGQGEFVFTYDLARDTTEAGTYPIVLVTYEMMCGNYEDPATAQLVRAFYDYVISDEGQRTAQQAAGSAPLSDALRQRYQPAVESISGGRN
ncbi:MAG: phosphate ABC transporter substrate-binding protein PstS [Pseudonocardiaceae bacterium]|nr:phosphate ABC transporter substrate-binding protein PstS [Pseudonocardiaceae bacterium]